MGEDDGHRGGLNRHDALLARPRTNNESPNEGAKQRGKEEDRTGKVGQMVSRLIDNATEALEIAESVDAVEERWELASQALTRIRSLARLLRKEVEETTPARAPAGVENAIISIAARLDAMEKNAKKTPEPTPMSNRTWAQVSADTGPKRAMVEVRLTEMEGAVPLTSEEKLQKVRKVIPDAKAIQQHPRAANKLSVLVETAVRKDQIMSVGIAENNEVKLIRRPRLIMITGTRLNSEVTVGPSEENKAWLKAFNTKNKVNATRVAWLYDRKKLEAVRNDPMRTRGSLIVSLNSQEEQHRLVRDGCLIGAEVLTAKLWDIAVIRQQCFKCWQWGHTQAVCNAETELCGKCADNHPTKECRLNVGEKEKARCAGCKKPGHFAWMASACEGYTKYLGVMKQKEGELNRATVMVRAQPSPPRSLSARETAIFHDTDGWTTVGESQKKRKRLGPGRPTGVSVAGKAKGQHRLDGMVSREGTYSFGTLQDSGNSGSTPMEANTIPATQ
jgi:hypothetical protein